MTDFDETRKRRRKAPLKPAPPKFKYHVFVQCPSCRQLYTFYSNVSRGDFYCPECKVIGDVKKVV